MNEVFQRNPSGLALVAENQFLPQDNGIMIDEINDSSAGDQRPTTIKEKLIEFKNGLKQRSASVDILLIFFGVGSWIGLNATFLQIPLLVETAPEGWRLGAFISVAVQLGNIGPITYTLIQKFTNIQVADAHFIYGVKVIGAIATLLMAFLYQETVEIGSAKYSVGLLVLVFFLAIVACTSSVLFMPYMGRFKEIYLITYLVGEGVSGLVPSVVTLIQGIGGPTECILVDNSTVPPKYEPSKPQPNFSSMDFFIFVTAVMICSLIAFILLENLKFCKKEYAPVKISHGNTYEYEQEKAEKSEHLRKYTPAQYKTILIVLVVTSYFGNGIVPSIQSFSCLPYGNEVYHLTVSLTLIVNPISSLLAIALPHSSIRLITTLIGIFTLTSIYILTCALMSPYPPLIGNSDIGGILIISTWTVYTGIFNYIKLCIITVMRSKGGNSLVVTGGLAQLGMAAGSITIFLIVNYTKLFKSIDPC